MNENEFCYYGKIYIAVQSAVNDFGPTCDGCAFDDTLCPGVACFAQERTDKQEVIFMEKQP